MKISKTSSLVMTLLSIMLCFLRAKSQGVYCSNPYQLCFQKYILCPAECPSTGAATNNKVCYVDCRNILCTSECRRASLNCNRPGPACNDPRLIAGDENVVYFYGKSKEHFSLVSDPDLQINARFTGHRPAGRSRDFTWVQALGFLFNSQKFSLEATKVATWDDSIDHLRFSFDGQDLIIPEEILSTWYSPKKDIKIRRATKMNSVTVTIKDKAEIMVNVVPVTKKDDRIQSYKVPSDDCLAHLEVQFRFLNLSPRVDGILGCTSRPGFQNQAKSGAAMPVVGGEDKFRTSSLLSHDCRTCIFTGLSMIFVGTLFSRPNITSSTPSQVHIYAHTLSQSSHFGTTDLAHSMFVQTWRFKLLVWSPRLSLSVKMEHSGLFGAYITDRVKSEQSSSSLRFKREHSLRTLAFRAQTAATSSPSLSQRIQDTSRFNNIFL
ncbi:unnamed protein product [Brassica rapa subsp. narinosa]